MRQALILGAEACARAELFERQRDALLVACRDYLAIMAAGRAPDRLFKEGVRSLVAEIEEADALAPIGRAG